MKLFVVILCYRVVDLTIDCLRSLSGEMAKFQGQWWVCWRTALVVIQPID